MERTDNIGLGHTLLKLKQASIKNENRATQVVVVGAGPSGSTVSPLLKSRGIDVVVIEKRRSLVSQLAASSLYGGG